MFLLILGPPRKILLLAMAEEEEGEPEAANSYRVFVFLMSANIPLAKASLMAKIMIKSGEVYSTHSGGRQGMSIC